MFESIFKAFVDTGNEYIWETPEIFPWLVALLLGTGIFVTILMRWLNVRKFKHAIDVIRGHYDNPADEGDINHFQALTTALSATVGIGNIAGVATAIHYGGPGTIFWLWVSGIFGMTLKYSECTLALHYRTFDENGNVSGGPMYYIERGLGKGWKWMAVLFAFLAIVGSFGSGNMNQSNTVALSAAKNFHAPDWLVGLILVVLVSLVILGGIRRIGAVTARVMPAMAILYILGAMVILVRYLPQLPGLFIEIIRQAWAPKAAFGGTAAGVWNLTLLWGVKRALFSNEAGQGSAPIAHAAAKTKEAVREGVVAMLEPFVDTLMICTLTGLVITITGVWDKKKEEVRFLDTNKVEVLDLSRLEELLVLEHSSTVFDTEIILAENEPEAASGGGELTSHSGGIVLHPKADSLLYAAYKTDFPDDVKFEGEVRIEKGRSDRLLFIVNDGIMEDAVLIKAGEPYNGIFVMENNTVQDDKGNRLDLSLEGSSLQNSSELTEYAFSVGFGNLGWLGNIVVSFCVFLFGFSTIISWSYYGDRCVEYLFGVKYVKIYRLIYVCFTFLGANLALETVWAYGDMALGSMMVPNLIAVLLLSPKVVSLTKDYFSRKHERFK
jgi:AGCS family alanine or glycine:cation symporter